MDVKEATSFDNQIDKLIDRGCEIVDRTHALRFIKRVNYYRFTAYFLPFKESDDSYREGTTFNNVCRIYEFDRKLRNLLFSVIEEIELMLRTQLSYYHSHKYGPLGYVDENNFNNYHNHQRFLCHIYKSVENNQKQAFVKHHLENREGKFPLWVIIELFTMGELSLFYADMLVQDQKYIARTLFHSVHYKVSAWLRCLTDLRNYCAHYSRLYYNLFPAIPPTPNGFSYTLGKRIFDYILVLKFLYNNPIKWNNVFMVQLQALIEEYSDCINLEHIGFPKRWKCILFEQTPTITTQQKPKENIGEKSETKL